SHRSILQRLSQTSGCIYSKFSLDGKDLPFVCITYARNLRHSNAHHMVGWLRSRRILSSLRSEERRVGKACVCVRLWVHVNVDVYDLCGSRSVQISVIGCE